MAITTDAQALEAKYGGKSGATQPPPMQDLYYPGSGSVPNPQGQIPTGTPVPEGTVISQVVGRGQPAMQVVPPKKEGGPPAPQIAIIPPQETGRTTIGTFVEGKSNPLAKATQGTVDILPPQQPIEPPKAEEKPKRKLDLAQELLTHIWELGGDKSEEAQKFYNRSPDALRKWQNNPGSIPLEAINRLLHRKPGVKAAILEELEPHFAVNGDGVIQSLPNRGKMNVVVCSPILERPTLPFHWTCLYLAKKYELGFQEMSDTLVDRSRNMLAHRFLQSGALWSLWLDGDMMAPIANPDWYKWLANPTAIPDEYTSYDVLARLMSHGKPVVGAVYASRKLKGQLVIQPEIRPRSDDDKLLCNEIRRGTARGLADVDWVGFGCSLVHREVFLEVQRRFPDLAPKEEHAPWRFFQRVADEGEDEAFCVRVRACSIPIWLDTQLICGHIGNACFLPEHTVPRPGI